ncbi:MAG: glycine cleavage system aminomethyltransferase GcvT [Parvularculaceae bacterium]|nr:glycine cleavage system aminomethyltransferase GcvT [Parvularculaceae bacterium]
MTSELKRTPLYDLHLSLGAKMVEFAGYEMPVQYADGVLKEHLHTRAKAGLFDVSHMGQAAIVGPDHETVARALETLVPGEILKLGAGRQRLSVLLNDRGGIVDDLMVSRPATDGRLNIVVNGACKEKDYAYLDARLPAGVRLERFDDRGLMALQGPMASAVLARHAPDAATLKFMSFTEMKIGGFDAVVTRGGYTGEDGYEISTRGEDTAKVAKLLLGEAEVAPIGLGARDSLRLEAGMCLYGHDLDEDTSPVEGNIGFVIGKRRKEEGGFPGAERILSELANNPSRLRVGVRPEGRAPAREGTEIVDMNGAKIGVVTSGGFGPTANAPVAMGYVDFAHSKTGDPVRLKVRGKELPATIVDMPVVPHNYYRG